MKCEEQNAKNRKLLRAIVFESQFFLGRTLFWVAVISVAYVAVVDQIRLCEMYISCQFDLFEKERTTSGPMDQPTMTLGFKGTMSTRFTYALLP